MEPSTCQDESDARYESAVASLGREMPEEARHFAHREENGCQEEKRRGPQYSICKTASKTANFKSLVC